MTLTLPDTTDTRQAIIDACLWMNASGINQGTSGNISVRTANGVLLTPSGVPYTKMRPDMLQLIPSDGTPDLSGALRPTTEWRFHQAVLRTRPDMVAVVHAHPAHATAVAIQRRPIPACHYMVAAFGGTDVPLVDYALYGSETLADGVTTALQSRTACILANHGAIVAGETLEKALWRLEELENLARVFLLAESTGIATLLSDTEMQDVLAEFQNYGPKDPDALSP